jgi:hypothetical protein
MEVGSVVVIAIGLQRTVPPMENLSKLSKLLI